MAGSHTREAQDAYPDWNVCVEGFLLHVLCGWVGVLRSRLNEILWWLWRSMFVFYGFCTRGAVGINARYEGGLGNKD